MFGFLAYVLAFLAVFFSFILIFTYIEQENGLDDPQPKKAYSLSVIIPAHNEEKRIGRCINSLLETDYPMEIIVVDDGSTDRTAGVVAGYSNVGARLIKLRKNMGKAHALNEGIKVAKGELIAVLDADSFVSKDAPQHMLGYFEDQKVAAVIPTLKVAEPTTAIQKLQWFEYISVALPKKLLSLLDSIYVTPGPFSIYRAEVLRRLGGFDENTLTEDHEIALRIQKAGYKIRCSLKAVVHTHVPENLAALYKQRRRWYIGYIQNTIKYAGMLSPKYGDFALIYGVIAAIITLGITVFMRNIVFFKPIFTYNPFPFDSVPLAFVSLLAICTNVILGGMSMRSVGERGILWFLISGAIIHIFMVFFWILSIISYVKNAVMGVENKWRGR
ncbi:MAG: glycosyltransferase family 2 protein [Candidatus Micrarchaeia archaeon]